MSKVKHSLEKLLKLFYKLGVKFIVQIMDIIQTMIYNLWG